MKLAILRFLILLAVEPQHKFDALTHAACWNDDGSNVCAVLYLCNCLISYPYERSALSRWEIQSSCVRDFRDHWWHG